MSIIEGGIEMMDEKLERRLEAFERKLGLPRSTPFTEMLDRCARRSEENGVANMTLDEINEEIRLARLERCAQEKASA